MALTETKEYDKLEIVGQFKVVQVRETTVFKKDGVELSRKYHRFALPPGDIDTNQNWTDTDISGATDEVKAICAAVWTDEVKAAYKQQLIDNMFPRDPNIT